MCVRSTNEALLKLAADERDRMDATRGRHHRRERQDVDQGHDGGGRWRRGFATHASPESFNNEVGLPVTLLDAPADAQVVVAEMGARRAGDVAMLCRIARRTVVVVVTNVGVAHLEIFGSWETIVEASAEPVDALRADGVAVLNADDPVVGGLRGALRGTGGHVRALGLRPTCARDDVDARRRRAGRAFTLATGGGAGGRCPGRPRRAHGVERARRRRGGPGARRAAAEAAARALGAGHRLALADGDVHHAGRRARGERRVQREPRVGGGRAARRPVDGGRGAPDRRAGDDGGAGADLAAGARARGRARRPPARGPADHRGSRGAPDRQRGRARRRGARQRRGVRDAPTRRWTTSAARPAPGDVVLFKGSRVAGLERLAEALR